MRYLLTILLTLSVFSAGAQAPKGIRYQAVVRDDGGAMVVDQNITLRISILDGGATGAEVYGEMHKTNTNRFGLFNITIGDGVATGASFEKIPWKTGNKWVKIEVDIKGGNDFKQVSIAELMSVPYALYAETSGSSSSNDTSATNELITSLSYDSINKSFKITEAGIDHTMWLDVKADDLSDNKLNDLGDVQANPSNGDVLKWNGSKWVSGKDSVLVQQLVIINNVLSLTNSNGIVDMAPYTNTDNQQLAFDPNTNVLTLANGGQVNLTKLDNALTGVYFDSISKNLTITDNGTFFTVDLSFLAKPEPPQDLVLTGNTLTLTRSGVTVTLPTNTGPQGATGVQGIAGTNGTNGLNGATGATGIQGTQGIAGINGTNGLNGATGATGPQGIHGVAGTNGTNGLNGATGATGTQGIQGNTGATGPQGIAGANGTNGLNGDTGATGAQGIQGNTGATGPQGTAGINGTNGLDGAQGIAGTNGINGNDGAKGDTGATGPQGITGATGAQGLQGVNGNDGAKGDTGATGAQGIQGNTGATGTDGIAGATGANGNDGATGPQGPTGAANINGTLNYLVKFTPDGVSGGNSQLFDNGTAVGIGTVSPDSKLQINGAASQNALRIQTNGTSRLFIAANGYTAIGNTFTPAYWLDVANNSANIIARVSNTNTTGTGLAGVGNTATGQFLTNGSGLAGTGTSIGVAGFATATNRSAYGGYFVNDGIYAYVGGWNLSGSTFTPYKIIGNGTVSTIVENTQGEKVTMFSPEAPEVLFQDYGVGQLVNGQVHITIDPNFARNISTDTAHPVKVFVQLEGACNGVYVDNKSVNGFDVVELASGTSNAKFSWSIIGTRKNEMIQGDHGTKEAHFEVRFPQAPLAQPKSQLPRVVDTNQP